MNPKYTTEGFWCRPSQAYYKIRNKMVISIFVSLVVVLAFNIGLVFFAFKNVVSDLVVSQNRIVAEKINRQSIQTDKLAEIKLEHIQNFTSELSSSVEVLDKDYSSLYVLEKNFSSHALGSIVELIKQHEYKEKKTSSFTIDGDLISFFPLSTKTDKQFGGYIVFTTPSTYINQQVTQKIITNIQIAFVVLLLTTFIIFKILQHIYIKKKSKNIRKKTLIATFLAIIIIPQLGITAYNGGSVYDGYRNLAGQRMVALETLIQSHDVDEIANKAEFSKKLDSYLHEFPVISSIKIFDKNKNTWVTAQENEEPNAFLNFLNIKKFLKDKSLIAISDETGATAYYFSIKGNKSFVFTNISKVILNLLTSLVLSSLLFFELLLFLFSRKVEVTSFQREEDNSRSISIRALAFLTIFTLDMVISFLPLYVDGLYKEPILGLGKDFFRPLPIVFELFFVTVAIFTSRKFFINAGWQYPLFFGILLIALGNIFSYLSTEIIPFILSRGFIGFGYGLNYVAFNSYLVTKTEKNKRSQGFAHLGSAIVTGTIVGGLTGGILVWRIYPFIEK